MAEPNGELTAKTKKAVEGIRKPFGAFVKDFTAVAQSREELAPKFMKAFGQWQAETAGTFVDFIRYLVPDVGKTRAEYRSHRAYQAADYLRRLVAAQTQRRTRTPEERATAPATPMDGMARLLAAVVPLVPEDQRPRLWDALHIELHWSDRQIHRLMNLVQEADPVIDVKVPRGQHLPALRISVPQHAEAPEAEEVRKAG